MILITHPKAVPNELELIKLLFEAGLQTLHVRKPTLNKRELKEFIACIDERYHSQLMIHSEYELLDQFQLKGIHFTEKTKHLVADYSQVNCCKSMAVHELAELDTIPATIDYVLLSPLFPSISKEGYAKVWDVEELKAAVARKRSYKIAALGGITLENLLTVKELGFDDYVLLGSIWKPALEGCDRDELVRIFNQFANE